MSLMPREIVLLRGVNVGTGRKLSMAALREALEAAGCSGVSTYIQSGNVVLAPPQPAPADRAAWLEGIIAEVAGFEVLVVLRSYAELQQTVACNPYPGAGGTKLHVVFFPDEPGRDALDGVDLAAFEPEECSLVGRDLYLHLPDGMGRAKLPVALEKAARRAKSPLVGTARNWNTVLKLVELAGS
jgi:uncharacterized protein (DUF1697 family)